LAVLAGLLGGLRIYLEPHIQFRKQHAKYSHLLTPVPVEHCNPIDPPADWNRVNYFGVQLQVPPNFFPSPRNENQKKGGSVVYVEPISESGILFGKPTDGRRDLRQTYDLLEIQQDFPYDVRPWGTSYDYWLTIRTSSFDQFSWTLSRQHVRELDWILRMREQRLAMDSLMRKTASTISFFLGENEHARWIIEQNPNWRNNLGQVFSKSDHRVFVVNWLDSDLGRGTEGIHRLCNSVRFE
jgi:hypothetical protein